MRHVLWIGGPPGSGKTTVATRIARRHGLRLYSADTRTWEHRDRAIRQGIAAAIRWEAMTPEERWQTSTAAEMLEQSLHRERGQMVVEDLRALPRSPLVVAEGSTLPATADRRALLREANEAVVAQVRGFYARPWADGDPEEVVRTFLCECGDQICELSLDVRVDAAGNGPVLAAGHS